MFYKAFIKLYGTRVLSSTAIIAKNQTLLAKN